MSSRRPRLRGLVALSALLLGTSMLSACDNGDDIANGGSADDTTGASADSSNGSSDASDDSSDSEDPAGSVSTNVKRKTDVPVSTQLLVIAHDGRLSTVTVSGSGDVGALTGAIAGDGGKWKADDLLEPGTTYTVKASVAGDDGEVVTKKQQFTTQALSLSQQTYASVAPLPGETVGVGMPVVVTFDVPVTDRANIEKHLHVTTAPEQPGTWHWLSDTEVHYRPEEVLEGRHHGRRRPRRQRRRRRQRHLRPGGPRRPVPDRRRPHLQGGHEHPPDEGLLQRQAAAHPADHHRRAAEVHHPLRASR